MVLHALASLLLVLAVAEAVESSQECRASACGSNNAITPIHALRKIYEEISTLNEILSLLTWDEQVLLPKGSISSRARQKAVLTSAVYAKSTSAELKSAIESAKNCTDALDEYERAAVRDAERNFHHLVKVPVQLEQNINKYSSICSQTWAIARKKSDFKHFEDCLSKMLQFAKEKALAIEPDKNIYDTRIDMFERGMSTERLQSIFDHIKTPLRQILDRTIDMKSKCKRKVHPALLGGDVWDIESQKVLSRDVSELLGFDLDIGRIDISTHPFSGGAGPKDVRITARYSSENPFEGIIATAHEAGHAIYEQGRNEKYAHLPVSEHLSMGVHESQSLFMERMILRNYAFSPVLLEKIQLRFPHTRNVTAEDLFFALNQVKPDMIRVTANELTYPFHVMLRFDLERRLMSEELSTENVPTAWNSAMKEYLGVDVPNNAQGCLQDIHWSLGAFGYFPSYSLGAMMTAQLFHFMKTSVFTDMEQRIGKSDFVAIRKWLNENIHRKGSLHTSLDELLLNVTGEVLDPDYFIKYLDEKYAKVYA